MRILVTGSRGWTDKDAVWGSLDILAGQARELGEEVVVVHGACFPDPDPDTGERPMTSGDYLADLWVADRRGRGWPVSVERHPAQWRKYGRAAGPIRNAALVRRNIDVCVAFLGPCTRPRCDDPTPHPSHGAFGCVDLAEAAGIPVQTVERWEET